MRDLLQNVKQFHDEEVKELVEDKEDYSVVRYGVCCTLRGRQVFFLSPLRLLSSRVIYRAAW
jgi:hypothetical protein